MKPNKKSSICITGINGQLGQFLAKYIQENEPEVQIIGTIRHKSYDNQPYIFDKSTVVIELMDLSDVHSIENLIIKYKPDFFVNTAANAFVGESWAVPVQHIEQNTLGVLHQLEAIRKHSPLTRYFNMGTSEEFGCRENNGLQDESTIIAPKSPYGCAKAAARYLIGVYRKSYGLYAIQNWTFNFESELRGEKYVTKKVTMGVARISKEIKSGKTPNPIEIGNLDSYRSWQFCGDVADSIWKCLNQEKYNPSLKGFDGLVSKENHKTLSSLVKEYVVSSPETHSIRELIEVAFSNIGIEGKWSGHGTEEKFLDSNENLPLVIVNAKFLRPVDVTFLNGDSKAIKIDLNWNTTISFRELIKRMVDWDLTNQETRSMLI